MWMTLTLRHILCRVEDLAAKVYSYAQPQVLSRLNVLRGLKESMGRMPALLACGHSYELKPSQR